MPKVKVNKKEKIKCTGCHKIKEWKETFWINKRPFCTVCIQQNNLFKNEGN